MQPASDTCKDNIVRLVGEKPIIRLELDKIKYQCLWDTGSMVSLVSKEWLDQEFPNYEILPVSEFIHDPISLHAANGSALKIEGVVILQVSMPSHNVVVKTPFLVTGHDLCNPVVGFNLIKYIVQNTENLNESKKLIMKAIPMGKKSAKALVNAIQDLNCVETPVNVYLLESVTVPSNTFMFMKCRVRGLEKGHQPVRFLMQDELNEGLVCPDSILNLKSSIVLVPVANFSDNNIALKARKIVGSVHVVKGLMTNYHQEMCAEVNVGNFEPKITEADSETTEDWLPPVDLSHLSEAQREKVEKLLVKYNGAFSKNPDDIGYVKDLQLDIELMDETTVHKPYRRILNCYIQK